MALFVSTQSGNFSDPATWGGIGVPDMGVDDVIIDEGHEVTYDDFGSMWGGHLLAVFEGATFRVTGGLDMSDSTLWIEGTVVAEGSHLAVWGGSEMLIQSGGALEVTSSFYLESSATATVEGLFIIDYSGYADIYYDADITVESGAAWEVYGYCYLEDGSEAFLHGDLYVDNGGSLDVAYYAVLTVEQSGSVYVFGYLYIYYYCRIEVFGYFGLDEEGHLYLDYQGLINVYRDIYLSGRMYGGGRMVMLRREGHVYDYYGNSLIELNRAYGFGQTRIA